MKQLKDLEFSEIMRLAIKRKLLIFGVFSCYMFAYYTLIHLVTFKYVAELKVMPAQPSDSLLQGSLGGLAAAAGVKIGQGQSAPPFVVYPVQLKSREIAEVLTKDSFIMQTLFANNWDAKLGIWKEDKNITRSIVKNIKSILGIPVYPWRAPAAPEVQKILENFVEINEDKSTSIQTLSFASANPEFAKQFLWKIHKASDAKLRERSLARSEKNVEYLQRKLNTLDVTTYKQALTEILVQQERQRMVASSNIAFAAEPLGLPYTSTNPTRPRSFIILLFMFCASILTGLILSLVLEWRKFTRSVDVK
jgi:hypothetical protein